MAHRVPSFRAASEEACAWSSFPLEDPKLKKPPFTSLGGERPRCEATVEVSEGRAWEVLADPA